MSSALCPVSGFLLCSGPLLTSGSVFHMVILLVDAAASLILRDSDSAAIDWMVHTPGTEISL